MSLFRIFFCSEFSTCDEMHKIMGNLQELGTILREFLEFMDYLWY